MVKTHSLLVTLSAIFILITFVGTATAQIQYHLEHEWVKIWINQNGTIDLLYNISLTCDSGVIRYVIVGQPNSDFTIGSAKDDAGHNLTATAEGERVRVNLYMSISSGQTARFSLLTNVARMIWEDTKNPGNVGMQFIPSWYDASIRDLRVSIVLPSGVAKNEVKTSVDWDNVTAEDGRLAIYWEKQNLLPDEQFPVGVSFPKEYVESYETRPTGVVAFLQQYGPVLLIFGVSVAVIGAVVYVVRKRPYLLPKISIETLGIRHGLTAVEASYLLDVKPTEIVTEILYSLLQKRAIWVESTTPSLKLKIMQAFQDKTGTPETPLRYYEIDFLNAIKKGGTLDEEKLAQTVVFLRDTVEEKLRGYCRRDTIDYYRKSGTVRNTRVSLESLRRTTFVAVPRPKLSVAHPNGVP
jgi:hypothetical protein